MTYLVHTVANTNDSIRVPCLKDMLFQPCHREDHSLLPDIPEQHIFPDPIIKMLSAEFFGIGCRESRSMRVLIHFVKLPQKKPEDTIVLSREYEERMTVIQAGDLFASPQARHTF